MPELTISSLTKSFGSRRVLDEIGFTVPDQQFVTLLGPSGCGKTTTLMSIAGFTSPDAGRICHGERVLLDTAERRNVAAERRDLGVVFQSYALWPHLSVAGNVAFPLKVRRAGRKEIRSRVAEVLELVELGHRADAHPHELSGGQQQRVALARALAHGPSMLLLDEPFSNLDAKLRERARDWLKALQHSLGITTVFVTHDQTEAMAMSDQIIVMNEGRIVRTGTPEDVYRHPGDRFTAEFLGRCNFLTGTVAPGGATRASSWLLSVEHLPVPLLFLHDVTSISGDVTLAIRPEALVITDDADDAHGDDGPDLVDEPGRFTATISKMTFLGEQYLYTLTVGPHVLTALSSHRFASDKVRVTVSIDAASVVSAP